MKRAWYLGHTNKDVGDRAILIGDPDRVDRLSHLLENAVHLPVSRGLKTVTGAFAGKTMTIVAFGMGAPIATIVMHELADLGVTRFVRIGTAMYFPPAKAGDFLISRSGIGYDGTSSAYLQSDGPVPADEALVSSLQQAARTLGQEAIVGSFATYDAFYRDMFGIDEVGRKRASSNRKKLNADGVAAMDMETAALLAAAAALEVSCAALCLGTVDALTQAKLPSDRVAWGEATLFDIALNGLSALN